MLFVLACALACSWFATKMQAARKQREAAERVRALGGYVSYDFLFRQQDAIKDGFKPPVDVRGTVLAEELHDDLVYFNPDRTRYPDWAYRWLGVDFFHTVTDVTIVRDELKDEDLECLRSLPNIERLSISGRITDCAMTYVKDLRPLKELDLLETRVGDDGLADLVDLPCLESLDVGMTQVTNAGAAHIAKIRSLAHLTTNSGFESVWGISSRDKPLNLAMSWTGISRIHDALPNCYISTHFCDCGCMDVRPEEPSPPAETQGQEQPVP